MAYERSTRQTYQKWADEIGDQSYTFDNISPYFQRSLNFTPPDNSKRGSNATPQYDTSTLGEGGYLDITFSNYAQGIATWIQKGMEAVGISPINGFTSGELIGSSWVIGTINHTLGVRESSETAFLRPALGRANLAIHIDTMAKKILFQGTTAIGVQVESSGYPYTLSANKEVIISAGTFQSPQLLMVSGIGPSSILDEHKIPVVVDSAGVGQNMWDHILFGPSYRVNVQTASALSYGDNIYAANEEFISQQDGLLASPGGDFLGRSYSMLQSILQTECLFRIRKGTCSFTAKFLHKHIAGLNVLSCRLAGKRKLYPSTQNTAYSRILGNRVFISRCIFRVSRDLSRRSSRGRISVCNPRRCPCCSTLTWKYLHFHGGQCRSAINKSELAIKSN